MIPGMVDTLLEWLNLPGETAAAWLVLHAPSVAGIARVAEGSGRITLVVTISVLCWLFALLLLAFVVEKIRDLDRRTTSYLSGRYAEAKRQLRILRRRIVSAIGLMKEQHATPAIVVSTIDLPQLEARVLRCFGSEGAKSGILADEIASKLKLTLLQVEAVLRHLLQEHLVERGSAASPGREAHRITQAGQIYLLEH
jgi:DNA-binding MarR family transcriptional regulator